MDNKDPAQTGIANAVADLSLSLLAYASKTWTSTVL